MIEVEAPAIEAGRPAALIMPVPRVASVEYCNETEVAALFGLTAIFTSAA